jgi:ribonuclease HI
MEALVNSARDNLTIEIDSIYAMKTCMEWMDARAAAGLPPVRFVKVKGHAKGKRPLNDAADDRATCASGQVKSAQAVGPWSGEGMLIGARR